MWQAMWVTGCIVSVGRFFVSLGAMRSAKAMGSVQAAMVCSVVEGHRLLATSSLTDIVGAVGQRMLACVKSCLGRSTID